MAAQQFEQGAVLLGAVGMVAAWRRPTGPRGWTPSVIVMQASSSDDGVFTPAADIMVTGRPALEALRAAVDEALKEPSTAVDTSEPAS